LLVERGQRGLSLHGVVPAVTSRKVPTMTRRPVSGSSAWLKLTVTHAGACRGGPPEW
jgi:hypothetical protein